MQMIETTALEMKQLIQTELHAKEVTITEIGGCDWIPYWSWNHCDLFLKRTAI